MEMKSRRLLLHGNVSVNKHLFRQCNTTPISRSKDVSEKLSHGNKSLLTEVPLVHYEILNTEIIKLRITTCKSTQYTCTNVLYMYKLKWEKFS